MAEIRVEREKRGLGWLWALLALLLLALAAWWFLTQRQESNPAPADTTSPVDTVAPDTVGPDTTAPGDTAGDSIGALLRTPEREPQLAFSGTFQGGPNGTT
jgi:hypothetical protein